MNTLLLQYIEQYIIFYGDDTGDPRRVRDDYKERQAGFSEIVSGLLCSHYSTLVLSLSSQLLIEIVRFCAIACRLKSSGHVSHA